MNRETENDQMGFELGSTEQRPWQLECADREAGQALQPVATDKI